MNYRHAFHAGNFADVVKHALLLDLLRAMQRKDKPFLVLDTHAGIGRYDLSAGPAEKTGEWRDGIAKILAARPEALADYLALVEQLGLYPGSPALAAALLRPGDRLIACELHPEDAATLKQNFRGSPGVAVHERDGYEALRAFLPPPERRGLVLIDPPFERPDEFAALEKNLRRRLRKIPHRGVRGVVSDQAPRAGAGVFRAPQNVKTARRGRRGIFAPPADRPGAAERVRPAGGQSAFRLRTRRGRDAAGNPGRARRAGRQRPRGKADR